MEHLAINGKNTNNVDWDEYIESYAEFINNHNIKLFMELDIDSVVGIKEVERLRNKLERLTNKQCILYGTNQEVKIIG